MTNQVCCGSEVHKEFLAGQIACYDKYLIFNAVCYLENKNRTETFPFKSGIISMESKVYGFSNILLSAVY